MGDIVAHTRGYPHKRALRMWTHALLSRFLCRIRLSCPWPNRQGCINPVSSRMPCSWPKWHTATSIAYEANYCCISPARQTSSPGKLHGKSGATIYSDVMYTASQQLGALPQAGCTSVPFPEILTLSENLMPHLRHGLVRWSIRARGRAWCLRQGMTGTAWDGWAAYEPIR